MRSIRAYIAARMPLLPLLVMPLKWLADVFRHSL
jgi:hypothetical protein